MKIEKVNISEKLSSFSEYWNPKIVGELNGQQVKLVAICTRFWIYREELLQVQE